MSPRHGSQVLAKVVAEAKRLPGLVKKRKPGKKPTRAQQATTQIMPKGDQ